MVDKEEEGPAVTAEKDFLPAYGLYRYHTNRSENYSNGHVFIKHSTLYDSSFTN